MMHSGVCASLCTVCIDYGFGSRPAIIGTTEVIGMHGLVHPAPTKLLIILTDLESVRWPCIKTLIAYTLQCLGILSQDLWLGPTLIVESPIMLPGSERILSGYSPTTLDDACALRCCYAMFMRRGL